MSHRFNLVRRRWLLAAAALTSLLPAAAWAQIAMQSVGVFSLLGDSVQVVGATDAPGATRIERLARDSLDFKGIGFDTIALRAARGALQTALPKTQVSVFKAPNPLAADEQRALAIGASRGELPNWMVATIRDNKLTHVLLITRNQGPADFRTSDGTGIGRGTVDGIGFYIDTLYSMLNRTTGALSTGLIGPYAQIRLSLMDTQTAEIVKTYDVRTAFAWASKDIQLKAEPWEFMTPTEKITTLREMVDSGVKRGMTFVLAP